MEIAEIQHLVEAYGPWAVGVGSTLDNTGLPIFFVLGMGAALKVGGTQLDHMLVAAIIGSVIGDLGTYAIGRYYLTKERILVGTIGQRFAPILKAGERTMLRWGILSILLSRFIPYLGKIIPLLAGSYRLSWFQMTVGVTVGSMLHMGFFFLYSEAAYAVITGHATLAKMVSVAIGTLILILLFWLNAMLAKRNRQSDVEDGSPLYANENMPITEGDDHVQEV